MHVPRTGRQILNHWTTREVPRPHLKKINLFIFNWRIIALQHRVGFCQTAAWISQRYTYVPSLLNLPPPTASCLMCLLSWVGEGNGNPLQYSHLGNPVDEGAWWAAVHRFTKSQTGLSDFTFTFHFHALGNEMATHSSVLAWRIPGTGEPGGLLSMGSHRVRHDWSDLAAAAAALSWVFRLGFAWWHICF